MTPSRETGTAAAAAAAHDGLAAAYEAQRQRLWSSPDMWAGCAGSFKPQLDGPPNPFIARLAAFLRSDDVLLDVGGGAGRLSLPLAGSCRDVVCIDPSQAMGDVFESTARDAGIKNARFVRGGWLEVEGVEGDVALVGHVTYFVQRIVPFIEKLNRATRGRVVAVTRSVPPPNQVAPFFKLVRGEELATVPGHRELLAVLEETGITAELIDAGEALAPVTAPVGKTPADAVAIHVEGGVRLGWLQAADTERAREVIAQHFDELFVDTEAGYRPRVAMGARELIITWETRK